MQKAVADLSTIKLQPKWTRTPWMPGMSTKWWLMSGTQHMLERSCLLYIVDTTHNTQTRNVFLFYYCQTRATRGGNSGICMWASYYLTSYFAVLQCLNHIISFLLQLRRWEELRAFSRYIIQTVTETSSFSSCWLVALPLLYFVLLCESSWSFGLAGYARESMFFDTKILAHGRKTIFITFNPFHLFSLVWPHLMSIWIVSRGWGVATQTIIPSKMLSNMHTITRSLVKVITA